MNDASPSVDPASLARPRRSERRFWAVWAILVGSLIVAGVASRLLSQGWWFALVLFLYFGAFKVAALIARKADNGYNTKLTPAAPSSDTVSKGVFPNSVMLASTGTGMALVKRLNWSVAVNASAKIMSAPASQ